MKTTVKSSKLPSSAHEAINARISKMQEEQSRLKEEVILQLSHYDSVQHSLSIAILQATRSQGMSDKALDCLVALSEVVKMLIFHLLDHKSLKLKIEQKDFTFLKDNIELLDNFMEKTVELVIKVQRTTMSLLQGEKSQPVSPQSPSLRTPLSTNPMVPPLPPDIARKLKDFGSRISSSRASMPVSHRISIINDLEQAQKLEITRLQQQLVSLIEASSGRNNPDSNEARAGIFNPNVRDVTLEDLLAASRGSSADFFNKKQKLDDATWGSELRGLYQNQVHA